jgi:hypothetical protein
MSLKDIYVVARIVNHQGMLCVNENCPKVLARHIEDQELSSELFGCFYKEGLKLVIVGMDGEGENTHTCVIIGASVPTELLLHYSKVVKVLDKSLFSEDKGMFWSHNANYIIIEDHIQALWWIEVVKEMNQSYTIEMQKQ